MAVVLLLYVIVELAAIVAVGTWIGFGWMLLLLLAGALVGGWLARREGRRAFGAMADTMRAGGSAHAELTDGMLVAVGGLCILIPGFLSDIAGFAFLLPPTRALLRRRWVRSLERRSPGLRTARMRGTGTVVDGEVVDAEPTPPTPRPDQPRIVEQ